MTTRIHVNTERLLDAIDEETLIVPISHVIFRSAFIQDVEAIVEKAHRVGAYVLLDSFQATGTVPFDVQKLNVDFCTGGVLKWLCGGPGTAYLYVRPDLAKKLEPPSLAGSATKIHSASRLGQHGIRRRFTASPRARQTFPR